MTFLFFGGVYYFSNSVWSNAGQFGPPARHLDCLTEFGMRPVGFYCFNLIMQNGGGIINLNIFLLCGLQNWNSNMSDKLLHR